MSSFNIFDSWTEYRVHILFTPWYTTTVLQFVLSCIGLFLVSMLLAALVTARVVMVDRRRRAQKNAEDRARLLGGTTEPTPVRKLESLACWYAGFVATVLCQYVLGALVGMALMSFNPWVFVAIVGGYLSGDVLTVHVQL